jgi:hypothetical protein
MLRFPKRRTPWLTAWCLLFNTLLRLNKSSRLNGLAAAREEARKPPALPPTPLPPMPTISSSASATPA